MRIAASIGAILLLLTASGGAWAKDRQSGTAPADPCAAARYVMPPGVETTGDDPGVAPADLPDSHYESVLPPKITFELGLNPLGRRYDQSELKLGEVSIDRQSGETTVDGKPLGGQSPADAQAACGQTNAKPTAKAAAVK